MGAAEEVFADQGLHAAHMGEIATRAGVAVGTLYNHFEDREALLEALLESRRKELLARVDAALHALEDGPFAGKMHALFQTMLEHGEAHRKFFQILLQGEIGRYQATFPSACRMPTETMKQLFGRVDRVVKQGIASGELRAEVADLAPVVFMGMVRGLMIRDALTDGQAALVPEADRLFRFFMEGGRA